MNKTSTSDKKKLPDPNPVTQAAHRKEFRGQIILPIALSLGAMIAIVFLFVYLGIGTVERWMDISLIFLLGIVGIFALITFLLLAALVYFLGQALGAIPPYTRMTQDAIDKIGNAVKKGADYPVQSLIQLQGFIAMVEHLFRFGKRGDDGQDK